MKKKFLIAASLLIALAFFTTCKKSKEDQTDPITGPPASNKIETSCTDLNLFGIAKDKEFGQAAFAYYSNKDSSGNIVMDSATYSNAYKYLYSIRDEIFSKVTVDHESDFEWKMRIIKDDTTLNAFCTPGGYIFVYTGIIKYLDSEDDFAGVLGHEIGHAALRHSTDAMTKQAGTTLILQAIGGDQSAIVNIVRNLGALKYSRCHESQADEYSVLLLQNTKYKCNGAASFFDKIVKQGGARTPAFLSTHPDPGDRVTNINAKGTQLNCVTKVPYTSGWAQFKTDLGL